MTPGVSLTTWRGLLGLVLRAVATIALVALTSFLYRGLGQRRKIRSLRAQGIPVLPHSWIWGHLKILQRFQADHPPDVSFYVLHTWLVDNAHEFFPALQGKAPPVIYLDLWPVTENYALVYDAVAVTQFTQVRSLDKHDIVRKFLVYMTQGVDMFSAPNGQIWKTWRTRFNPGFSSRNITHMIPELLEEISAFVQILDGLTGSEGGWGNVFPLEPKTTNLTFDIIVRSILDVRLHDQTLPGGSELKRAMVSQIQLMNQMPIVARGNLPFVGSSPARLRQIENYNDIMKRILIQPIRDRMGLIGQDVKKKTAVDLALKVMAEDEAGAKEAADKDPQFIDRLCANLKVMMFAGHDTTSAAICFMSKCLQDNPECLEKMRQEHDTVVGPDPDSAVDILTESPHLIYSLPYTLGVVKETLRLHPLASALREGAPGFFVTTRDNSQTHWPLERGWGVWTAVPGVHRNPDYWPRPNEFLPERWCVDEGHPLHVDFKDAWSPFSLGPRNCIGQELAMTELKLVCVMVYRRFEIREGWEAWDKKRGVDGTPNHTINGERLYHTGNSTVHPKDGMPVQVRLREPVRS